MKDNNLDIFALRNRAGQSRSNSPLDRVAAADADADEEECLCFGYLRGIRDTALSLEVRLVNGNRQAFPYSWLGPATYNPSAGLLIKFVGDLVYLVLLEGSNLNALVNGLHRQLFVVHTRKDNHGHAGRLVEHIAKGLRSVAIGKVQIK